MSKNWHISRRRMLQGTGACIALPFLEAMALPGVLSPEPSKPIRTSFFFMPNGVNPHLWTPEKTGMDFELSPQLKPLEKLKKDILILGELMNKNSIFPGADGHYAKTANLLTCQKIKQTTGENISSGGISIDQLIANEIGGQTLFPSLEYGLDRIRTGVDLNVGFTLLYSSSISWKSATQPLSKEIDPRMAFDRLFKSFVPGKEIKVNPWEKSILDLVMDDAKRLKNNLGRMDQDKLSEYLESIRSVEKRILSEDKKEQFAENITPDIVKELVRLDQKITGKFDTKPSDRFEIVNEFNNVYGGVDVTEKTRLMMDIMTLAFWCDASRTCTFMFGNSVSGRNFSFLDGVTGSHHSISHHMDNEDKMLEYAKIATWHVEQYAYFLQNLKSIKEGDGTLLDNSMAFLSSSLRDGNRHSPRNLPVLLGGKGGGKLKTGQNLIFEEDTPLANLYYTMLNVLNIEKSGFGDSNRLLTEVLV
ncbi:MAG: DUF1552 domain-containing protein [Bacteroidetes bacterium]|nr:DUF1552 domain-containing protein [Bacteroidota bacterium]MDA1122373.1 DUF1552 domain-containing protein [Bacteroidota bacterium]